MDNGDLFYLFGGVLAASAVVFSFIGLKAQKFPGKLGPAIVLWFAVLVVGATTFSVLHSQDEEAHHAAETHLPEHNEEVEEEENEALEGEAHE